MIGTRLAKGIFPDPEFYRYVGSHGYWKVYSTREANTRGYYRLKVVSVLPRVKANFRLNYRIENGHMAEGGDRRILERHYPEDALAIIGMAEEFFGDKDKSRQRGRNEQIKGRCQLSRSKKTMSYAKTKIAGCPEGVNKEGCLMDMSMQGDATPMMRLLDSIPVYPESIRIHSTRKLALASELGLCEDEKGRVSWISEEAKRVALCKRAGKTCSMPEHKAGRNKSYSAFGKSQTLREWANEYGIHYQTLNTRLNTYGMRLEDALTKPMQTSKDKARPHI